MESSPQMSSLFDILKWYLMATLLYAAFSTVLSFHYITGIMTDSQEMYLSFLIDVVTTSLYLIALKKTLSACKETT